MSKPTQQDRFIGITTPLGPDKLLLKEFRVREQVSRLFEIDAELVSEDGEIAFDQVVGHKVTLRLDLGNKDKRYFNGLVSRLVQVSNEGGYARYQASVVPWLWFLTHTSDCRIFQKKKVPEILEEVFKGHGFSDYKLKLSGAYAQRDYCVQYRETDFNFVSRLMEEEGIYYFFQHENDTHTLVIADSISAHKPFSGYEEIIFHELEEGAEPRQVITDWSAQKEVKAVSYALNDFDFKKPKASLRAASNVIRNHGNARFEIYDYPGQYVEHDVAQRLAEVRLDELQTECEVFLGQASARGVAAGSTFKLKQHPRKDQNHDYFVTAVNLAADAGPFASSGETANQNQQFFSCTFRAIQNAQQFRPARITPKPGVQGIQTAIVVGPSGETIHTDQYGRIKVKFHWDRHAKGDDNSSCWIRVSQPWGGKNWGGMFIPHVGQEVVVSFEEGDPDRPLITGRVYNPDEMPPLPLPANKTASIIRDHGGNHIRLEGKEGKEQIHLYSPYGKSKISIGAPNQCPGLEFQTENKCKIQIGEDEEKLVKGMCKEVIEKDYTIKILENKIEEIEKERHETIHGPEFEVFKKYFVKVVIGALNETAGSISELCLGNKTEVVALTNVKLEKAWEFDLARVGKKHKISKLQELMEEHKEFTEKIERKAEKCKDKYFKLMQKIEDVELASKRWKGKIGKEYELEAKKLTHKSDKVFLKAADAVMDYDKAKVVCDLLKLC